MSHVTKNTECNCWSAKKQYKIQSKQKLYCNILGTLPLYVLSNLAFPKFAHSSSLSSFGWVAGSLPYPLFYTPKLGLSSKFLVHHSNFSSLHILRVAHKLIFAAILNQNTLSFWPFWQRLLVERAEILSDDFSLFSYDVGVNVTVCFLLWPDGPPTVSTMDYM